MKSGKKLAVKILIALLTLAMVGTGTALYLYKGKATGIESNYFVKITNNDNVESLTQKLRSECNLKFPSVFKMMAERMNLKRWMKKGRYEIKPEMTIVDIIRLFREGKSKTVNFTIKEMTALETLAENCGTKLEADAPDFMALLQDSSFLDTFGFSPITVFALPIPDTYNLLWHTEPDEFFLKLKVEYDKFWTAERKGKAEKIGLTPMEVSILASIVCKETNKYDEMPMVAGMYINRLKINMPLQADPTIKFALNEPALKRIYNIHLQVVSPYNTYMHKGLPPGPICIPGKKALDAVLDHSGQPFLYMCAKEDFSGYHNFAVDYNGHLRNAKKYRVALDKNGVK